MTTKSFASLVERCCLHSHLLAGKAGMESRLGMGTDKKTCQMCKTDFMPRVARTMLQQHVSVESKSIGTAHAPYM